jgi:hypothetical protein
MKATQCSFLVFKFEIIYIWFFQKIWKKCNVTNDVSYKRANLNVFFSSYFRLQKYEKSKKINSVIICTLHYTQIRAFIFLGNLRTK